MPKPTMVWNPSRFCTNERIGNLSCAITKLKSHVLSLVKTTVGFGNLVSPGVTNVQSGRPIKTTS